MTDYDLLFNEYYDWINDKIEIICNVFQAKYDVCLKLGGHCLRANVGTLPQAIELRRDVLNPKLADLVFAPKLTIRETSSGFLHEIKLCNKFVFSGTYKSEDTVEIINSLPAIVEIEYKERVKG